ncbi:MAG: site-specific integrase [SAR324 cluster bacterium]|nr:site-specific integrase [SAR324 cluster bacterium]
MEKFKSDAIKVSSEIEYRPVYKLLENYFGNVPLDQIDQDMVDDYKELLMVLPYKLNQNLKKDEIDTLIDEGEYKELAPKTKNQYFDRSKQFFDWCNNRRPNPEILLGVINISEDEVERDKKGKLPFEEKHLLKIFNPEIYLRESSEFSAYYWVPLIILHTGARIAEICQLQLKDVKLVEGIWVFDLNRETADKRHKKTGKIGFNRILPVHQNLHDLGFIEYFEQLKKVKDRIRVFEELELNKKNKYTTQISKWFNREYLKEIGVRTPENIANSREKLTFHSFRHTLRTMLIPHAEERFIDKYLGHSQGSKTKQAYTHEMVKDMNEVLLPKIQFPFLDFVKLEKDWK